jgi:hypothetical protein
MHCAYIPRGTSRSLQTDFDSSKDPDGKAAAHRRKRSEQRRRDRDDLGKLWGRPGNTTEECVSMSSAGPSRRSHRWPVTPIKVARVAAGLLQSDVAAAAGSTTTRISLLERGLVQATPQEAERLSAAIERLAPGSRS